MEMSLSLLVMMLMLSHVKKWRLCIGHRAAYACCAHKGKTGTASAKSTQVLTPRMRLKKSVHPVSTRSKIHSNTKLPNSFQFH